MTRKDSPPPPPRKPRTRTQRLRCFLTNGETERLLSRRRRSSSSNSSCQEICSPLGHVIIVISGRTITDPDMPGLLQNLLINICRWALPDGQLPYRSYTNCHPTPLKRKAREVSGSGGLKYLSLSVSRPRGGLGVERDGAERGGDFVERRGQPVVGHHLRDGGARRGVER